MRVRRLPSTCRCAFTSNRMLASELEFELPPSSSPSPRPTGGTGLVCSSTAGGKGSSAIIIFTTCPTFCLHASAFSVTAFRSSRRASPGNARQEAQSNACSFARKAHWKTLGDACSSPGERRPEPVSFSCRTNMKPPFWNPSPRASIS